jgi:signal transduction histidine kinase
MASGVPGVLASKLVMRLSLRAILLMLIAAGVPLALSGYSAAHLSSEALRARAQEMHTTAAQLLANHLGQEVSSRLLAVKLAAGAHPFARLAPEERLGALRLVFRQLDRVSVVALLAADGQQAAPPVYLSAPAPGGELARRLPVDAAGLAAFAAAIPFSAARETGAAIGPAHSVAGVLHLPLAVRAEDDMVLAVSLSLAPLLTLLQEPVLGERGRSFVVDDAGRVILARDREAVAAREDRSDWEAVATALAKSYGPAWHQDPEHGASLGATALVGGLQWIVVVAEPVEDALAAAHLVTRRLLVWLGGAGAAALLLGLLLGRAVVRPVQALHRGARQLGEGNLGFRVKGEDRADELGDLARAFNKMAAEIQRWNVELEERVREKTEEARRAQDQLLRAQKLAAVGQLGAGVAHEINNPLAGILGIAQLLRDRHEPGTNAHTMLTALETEAERIRDIVANLSALSSGEGGVSLQATNVHDAIDGALSLVEQQLRQDNIALVRDFGDVPEVYGDGMRLTEAFLEIIDNARRAMPTGGNLTIGSRPLTEKLVQVRFADTGPGIPTELHERIFEPFFTTKQEWEAKGLGLAVAHRIIEAHHGTIVVDSSGRGATLLVTLPAYQPRMLV